MFTPTTDRQLVRDRPGLRHPLAASGRIAPIRKGPCCKRPRLALFGGPRRATPQLKDDPPGDGRHHRLMAKNAITVTVSRPGFIATETFISTTDAQAWKDMVETTLEHIDKIHLRLGDLRSLTSPRPFAPTAARTPRTNGSR